MARKLIDTAKPFGPFGIANREARIYRDTEWNEFVVWLYVDGKRVADSDYHTDDKNDAENTAIRMLG